MICGIWVRLPELNIFHSYMYISVSAFVRHYLYHYSGILIHWCSFTNLVGCWHTALQHVKRRNTWFSMNLFSFHRCHAILTIFRLNEKIGIARHRLKNSLIVKSDFIRGGIPHPHSTLKIFYTVTYHLIRWKIITPWGRLNSLAIIFIEGAYGKQVIINSMDKVIEYFRATPWKEELFLSIRFR